MRKRIFIAVTILLTVAAFTIGLTSCYSSYDHKIKSGITEKATSLSVRQDGSFKIMQLTDLHLTSAGSSKSDNETLRWLEQSLDEVKPDLVELTGDIVGGGVKGRNDGILAVANIFEKRQVYWAYTFGNHDGEHSKKPNGSDWWIGKEGRQTNLKDACKDISVKDGYTAFYGDNTKGNLEIYELLKGYEYSLLTRSPKETEGNNADFMGVGNYVIDLKDAAGNIKFALFHMDTHGKFYLNPNGNTNPSKYIDAGYVGLTDMQVDWYKEKVKSYSENNIPSAIFMHVPNYGYRLAFENKNGESEYGVPQFDEKADIKRYSEMPTAADLAEGYIAYRPSRFDKIPFEKNEGIYAPRWEDGLMQAIKASPSTMLISVGHDHNNSFITQVDDTLLAYGRTSGVNAWGRDIPIGASVYTINTNGVGIDQIINADIVWPSFKYTKLGNR